MKHVGAVLALLLGALSACKGHREEDRAVALTAERAEVRESVATKQVAAGGRPELAVLTAVAIKTVDPDEPVDLQPELLGKQAGLKLTTTGHFAATIEDVPDTHLGRQARLDVLITYEVSRHGADAVLLCAVEAELVWLDGRGGLAVEENVIVERLLTPGERKSQHAGLVATQVANTLDLAIAGIAAKEALRTADAQEVVSTLSHDDPDAVAWALAIVGERQMVEAVDLVVGALGSKQPEIHEAAIGALVAIGDPRGVQPLAQLAEFADHDQMRTVIEAITAIGGKDAVEYLEFVASGHPDDEIKQRAADGLDRIRKNPRAAAR
jgi:hypothetical protein